MGRQRKTNDLDMALHDGEITKRDDIDPNRRWVWLLDEVRGLVNMNRYLDKRYNEMGALIAKQVNTINSLGKKINQLQTDNDALEALVNEGSMVNSNAITRELKWLQKIRELEQERDGWKNYCAEFREQFRDQHVALDAKDRELKQVVDREHTIHNEAAAGMIAKVEELEKQISDWKGVADQNENTITKLQQDLGYNKKLLEQYQEAFQSGDHVHHEDLEVDLAKVLNYWSQDAYLDIPDFILAQHLARHLDMLKAMQADVREWREG